MNVPRFTALLGLAAAAAAAVRAQPVEREQNLWPVTVKFQDAALSPQSWTGAGPFLFRKAAADAEDLTAKGFRPFWVQLNRNQGDFRAGYFLYPLFSYAVDDTTYRWSLFELIRQSGRRAEAGPPTSDFDRRKDMEVFPFWFSRESGDPELSYRALFPIQGTLRHRLGFER